MNFLGIDIGTGSVKACLLNEQGTIIHHEQKFYQHKETQLGFHEIDALLIASNTFDLIKISNNQFNTDTLSICFSSAMHSVMAVNEYNVPLTPLMLWSDTRSKEEATATINSNHAAMIYNNSGVPVHPMLPLTKIIWLQKYQPEVFNAAYKFISIKEFILYYLIKEYKIDYSLAASSGMFDMKTLDWNNDTLSLANINKEKLSAIVSTKWSTQNIDANFKKQLNLPKNTTIVIGSSDGCLANVGSNLLLNKDIAITIGTSAAIRINSSHKIFNTSSNNFNYLLEPGLFVCGGASNNGGNVMDWLIDQYKYHNNKEILEEAFSVDTETDELIIVPYFLGERAPVWNANATKIIYGNKNNYLRKHIARAVLEGVVMNLYLIAESILKDSTRIEKIVAGGGFTQSNSWLQLVADVFNLPVYVYSNADVSALGAAIWSGYCKNHFSLNDERIFSEKEIKIFYPNLTHHKIYQKKYSIFKQLALTQKISNAQPSSS